MSAVGPVGDLFARVGVHPNVLSFTGLLFSAGAGLLYSQGRFFWAAWVVLFAGICDTLDGHIARQTKKNSPFGAFFDSTLDRYSDMFLFVGLAYFYAGGPSFSPAETESQGNPWTVVVIVLAITGSFMVSYTRARAEGLGVQCKAGMMQRPERITLLIIGSLLASIPVAGPVLMQLTLLLLAVSVNLTALYRMVYVRKQMAHESEGQTASVLPCPRGGKVAEKYRNPLPTVDIIIEVNEGIVLIKRKNPPFGWALPGGFVDYGESLEEAARREAKEETGLEVALLSQLGAYSDPARDPRQHTLSVVFIAGATGKPKASDDAAEVKVFAVPDLPKNLAFDHDKILQDYLAKKACSRSVVA